MNAVARQRAERVQEGLEGVYARYDKWQARSDSAQERIARAQRTLDASRRHLGVRAITEQICDIVAGYFPDHKLEVLGPFGLGNETAIHAVDSGGLTVAGANFRPERGNRLHLVDWSRNTGEYPPGSLGAINQFNFQTYPEPATVADIVATLDREIAAHEREVAESERASK